MPQLHSLSGVLRGKVIELRDGLTTVGRGLDNILHLEDATISHHHAELMVEFGKVMLRDLDSTNGTRINGKRIAEMRLGKGDRLSFGELEMLFECDSAPDGERSPAGTARSSAAECHQTPGTQLGATLTTKFHSRLHALAEAQVVPDSGRCVQCGICSYNCPAGIDVRAHAWRGRPIFDSHCLTCSECVNRCPRGVLRFEKLALFAGAS